MGSVNLLEDLFSCCFFIRINVLVRMIEDRQSPKGLFYIILTRLEDKIMYIGRLLVQSLGH